MNRNTPWGGVPSSGDSDQLPLGAFEGAPLLPVAEAPREPVEGEAPPAYRELPVCGEWTYDTGDDAESRGGATVVESQMAVATRVAAAPGTTSRPTEPLRPARPPMTPRIVPQVSPAPTPLPALDELRSQHEAHPGDGKTAVALAEALDKRGNIAAALGVLQRAIDAGAEAVPLRCARAAILSGRLRYDDAEAELKRAAKVHPDDPDLLLQLGILACRRAKWRDAVEPLARLVKLDGASAQAHFYLGEALNKLDRLEEALVAYERGAELDAANWRALKGVGIVLDRMGRPADAAAYYRRARDAQSG